jgi:sensor histidine kinase YesM
MIEAAPRTNEMTTIFAELLRANLTTSVKERRLAEELDNIERYLKIQKIRFGDKLNYSISRDFDEQEVQIPSFILLPFVENTVVNGIMPAKEKGLLTINAVEAEDTITITIQDNGKGQSGKKLLKVREGDDSFAEHQLIQTIQGIRKRLVDSYGSTYEVVIENKKGKTTTCTIVYPKDLGEKVG